MILLALLLISALQIDQATPYWLYETLNVTQWQWQSSVAVENWLYIDGGELYAIEKNNPTFFYLGQTISINLSEPWTNATVQQYSKDTQRPTTDGHWAKRPSLFYNPSNDQVIQWGGWPYANGDLSYEFSFSPDAHGTVTWSQSETPITNSLDQNSLSPAVFGAAFVASNTSLYSLGGVVATDSAPPDTAVQGLVQYDFTTNDWTNSSSLGATSNGYLVGAQASYTPGSDQGGYGQAGFLVIIGGNDPETQLFDPQYPALVDMSNITLYDTATKTWYHQKATGTIPPPRQFFCSVAETSIQDTFEIFILGGSTNAKFDQDHSDDTDYLNVFTLSIPAFRWFKSSDSDEVRRADHSCQVIGNRQMLVIGGTQPSNPLGIAAVDPWPSGMGIFDMTAFTWTNGYNPSAAEYEQPEVVRDYYTYDYQAPVWDSTELGPIFAWSPPDLPAGTYPAATTTSPASGAASKTTSAPTSISSAKPASKTSHTGAVVGGVVGGFCAVIFVLILLYLHRKRRHSDKRKHQQRQYETHTKSIVIPKHELESPLSSAGLEVPALHEKETQGTLVELENPETSPRAELESHSTRRKPIPELP